MGGNDLGELVDTLEAVSLLRPPGLAPGVGSKPSVKRMHRALQELIVLAVAPERMNSQQTEVLQPLLGFFGQPGQNLKGQVGSTLVAAIEETRDTTTDFWLAHQPTEFWLNVLNGPELANVRLRRDDVVSYSARRNRSIKELAELLVHAIERKSTVRTDMETSAFGADQLTAGPVETVARDRDGGDNARTDSSAETPSPRHQVRIVEGDAGQAPEFLIEHIGDGVADQSRSDGLSGDSGQARQRNTPSVRVIVRFEIDLVADRTGFSVTLDGDLDEWYLAIIKAKSGKHPMPHTEVVVMGDPNTRPTVQCDGGEFELDEVGQVSEIERVIVRRYERSSDEVIVEICRVAIQYVRGYIRTPELIAQAISCVLSCGINVANLDATYKVSAHLNPRVSAELFIPKGLLVEHALANRVKPRKIIEYVQSTLVLVEVLDHDQLLSLGIPTIIERWLTGTDCDPEHFFNIGDWAIMRPKRPKH